MEVILETDQFILRKLTMDDLDAWYAILSDEEAMQYYPKPFDREKTKSWIEWNIDNYSKYGFGLWGVVSKETNQFLGDCGITMQNIHGKMRPEIGFHIDKRYWKRGYATHLAKACLRYAFDVLKLDEVFCYQKYTNIPSRRVAEKMGMKFREEYPDEVNTKTSVYSIKREEYC
ncbi:GNAT family N-acetyltransferase [Anaerosporobacter faecicola]|uniref:GNAT family N-acetyltransferase n=1 Tax=Anaerosporobacter faecicola TaxID=2718714 RepID=UPI00143CC01E|nr:GNAT family N-acetyltransferase [Anaerosporobacter faecicola]